MAPKQKLFSLLSHRGDGEANCGQGGLNCSTHTRTPSFSHTHTHTSEPSMPSKACDVPTQCASLLPLCCMCVMILCDAGVACVFAQLPVFVQTGSHFCCFSPTCVWTFVRGFDHFHASNPQFNTKDWVWKLTAPNYGKHTSLQ